MSTIDIEERIRNLGLEIVALAARVEMLERRAQEIEIAEQLTTDEAAQRIGVCGRTLERLRRDGQGPPFLRLGKGIKRPSAIVYLTTDVDDWLRSCRVEPGRQENS